MIQMIHSQGNTTNLSVSYEGVVTHGAKKDTTDYSDCYLDYPYPNKHPEIVTTP